MRKLLLLNILSIALASQAQELRTECNISDNSTILGFKDAKEYIKNYDDLHTNSRETHTKAYYVNNSTMLFLDSFFKAKKEYFGFNLYFVTYPKSSAKYQMRQSQALLYIAPVCLDPLKDTVTDFSALKKFYKDVTAQFEENKLNKGITCYGSCDSSLMSWLRLPVENRLNEIPGDLSGSDFFLLTKNRSIHKDKRDRFAQGHGMELNEQQTRWVYFDKRTVGRLAGFINQASNKSLFPMIGIYFGSYNKQVPGTKQQNYKQTMVGFIPMRKMVSGYYEPDICSYVEYWNSQMTFKKKDKDMLTDNHGQLCPKACPDDDN
jgi:hypothetical protein